MGENIEISFVYKTLEVSACLPKKGYLGTFTPALTRVKKDPLSLLEKAIKQPIGDISWFLNTNLNYQNVLIVIPDAFRYTGIEKILPEFISYLNSHGISRDKIRFAVSTGAHRPPSEEELKNIMSPEIYIEFRNKIIIPNPANLEEFSLIGKTKRGTPVYIHKCVLQSDLVILTGTIVFHYFAGFGGGRKSLVPGLSAIPTIQHNHALSIDPETYKLHPNVKIGKMENNPVAEDILEATLMIKKNILILNSILSPEKDILSIYFGDLIEAHRQGTEFARSVYEISIPEKAEIVIANAGNAKNFLQSHKALVNAWQARKEPYGKIILIAPSPEGIGGHRFKEWLETKNLNKLVEKMKKEGEVNGQTVISTLEKSPHTYFLTEMNNEEIALLGGTKINSIEEGFDLAVAELAKCGNTSPTWLYLPHASYSVPKIEQLHPF
ncbi:MAG: nickel-dependent lactate racemase [Candidatus Hydrogenedentes bacterium]|nr:nickel-dependent lactate racemase [Candidatus Hydrogenedentota bacterium]